MESLEAQFDALWEESRQKRKERVAELNDELKERVRADLGTTLRSVQSLLASERPELERQIEQLLRMTDELALGVEMWQQKAMSSIDSIDKEQKVLGSLVHEVSIRTAARKEDLLKRQQKRAAEVRSACMERFKEVELKL